MAERCCLPGQCAYTPSRVGYYLSVIRDLTEYGADVGEAAVGRAGGAAWLT